MNKQFKKSILSILSAVVVSCSGAALGSINVSKAENVTVNASEMMTLDGLTATYNVSGGEKVSKLVKDKTGIHFSANAKGNGAENSSVTFNNTLSGLFEMDFRVYTQNVASINYGGGNWWNGNNAEEIREVAITLTDADANQSFTLYIKGGTPYLEAAPNARVAYGDVGENYGTGIRYGAQSDGKDYDDTVNAYNGGTLASKDYNTSIRGTSFCNWYLHSTVVGFDPITKEVFTYNFKSSSDTSLYSNIFNRRVILDLDNTDHLGYMGTGASELLSCDFNNYTVKFTLTDVTGANDEGSQGKDEPANFIIYTLNGQSLAGENGTLTSSVAPGLAADFEEGYQYQDYTLPTPTLQGVLGEKATFDGNVKVLDPNGKVVVAQQAFAEGMTFTPELNGQYTVVYSGVKDGNGNLRKALTVSGSYTGAEIVYSYPLMVEKSYAITANASDIMTANGLDVTYNVAGNQQQADLIRDTNKGILFTSQGVGSDAVGASVAFNNALVGAMELNFRVFTETTDSSSDWWDSGDWYNRNNAEELREIAITVTDSTTGEAFTIYIKGGTMYNVVTPNARVAYGDVGANYGSGRWYKTSGSLDYYKAGSKGLSSTDYNTALYGTTFTNRARNSGWIGSGYSTNIGFDPVTKVVYGYTYCTGELECAKLPILDLDDPEDMQYLTMSSTGSNVNAGLPETFLASTFENYTMKVTVTEMTDDTTAKFIIYNLNGQALNGKDGKLMSTSGYGLYVPQGEARFVDLADTFPAPYASSVLTGEKPFVGTIEIVDENGNVVLPKQAYSENVTFTPAVAGNYIAYYGGMADENGCVRLAYNLGVYNGEEDRFAYAFEVKNCAIQMNTYNDAVLAKMGVEIGAKVFASNLTTALTIRKDGAVYNGHENVTIGANYTYAFQNSGSYELIYTVKTAAGGEVSYSTTIDVVGMTGFIKTAESVVMLGDDAIWDAKDFTIYYCNEGEISDFLIAAKVYDGNNWVDINTVPAASVNLKDALLALGEGEWLVSFEVSKDGESLLLEKTFISKDAYPPVISAQGFGEGFISVPEKDSETVKYFVVLEGTESVIPAANAIDEVDGAVALSILLKTPADTSAQEVAADTVIRFVAGEYVIVYRAVDNAGNETSFFYFVEVKTLWLTITAQVDTLELGSAVVIPTPSVVNGFSGETVADFTWTAKVTLGGEELKKVGGKYVPMYTGEYAIVYTVTYGDLSQEWSLAFVVEDTTEPVITVDGEYAAEAKVGDTISLLEAEVEDEGTTSLLITVIYNGATRVQVSEDNTFVVGNAGQYVIRYTATDMSGNTTNVEFTINVAAPVVDAPASSGGCSGVVGNVAAISVLMTLVGALTLRKKENE